MDRAWCQNKREKKGHTHETESFVQCSQKTRTYDLALI